MPWRRNGKSHTLHIVVALKGENTYSGWLSSVKTVALKRENTHQGGLPEGPDAGDAQEEAPRPLERAGGDAHRRELVSNCKSLCVYGFVLHSDFAAICEAHTIVCNEQITAKGHAGQCHKRKDFCN